MAVTKKAPGAKKAAGRPASQATGSKAPLTKAEAKRKVMARYLKQSNPLNLNKAVKDIAKMVATGDASSLPVKHTTRYALSGMLNTFADKLLNAIRDLQSTVPRKSAKRPQAVQVQTVLLAAKLCLQGELAHHGALEGLKCVSKYQASLTKN